jgi:imidazolonepropionase-like amidohydrolase
LGRLDVGTYADVIACPGDPFEDISELTRVSFVMKGGHVHRHEAES